MEEFKQKAQHCQVFYNTCDILVIAVHVMPPGFNLYGLPVNVVSRKISPELLGNLVIRTINESKTIYEENCVDTSCQVLYEYAGVKNWNSLGKKWKLISVERILDTEKVTISVYNSVKNGSYIGTTNNPVYCTDLNSTEIGNRLLSIME
jgi:hypothetical protein